MEPQNGFLYFHPELYLRNPFLDEVEWVSSIEEGQSTSSILHPTDFKRGDSHGSTLRSLRMTALSEIATECFTPLRMTD